MSNEIEKHFRITPKGILAALLIQRLGASLQEADELCIEFQRKIIERAQYDEVRGTAALVLDGAWHVCGASKSHD